MTARPPFDGTLDGTGAGAGEDVLQDGGSVVGPVGPESVVACGDAETGDVVVDDAASEGAKRVSKSFKELRRNTYDHQNVLVFQFVVQIP